jgi:hypothetical protein
VDGAQRHPPWNEIDPKNVRIEAVLGSDLGRLWIIPARNGHLTSGEKR